MSPRPAAAVDALDAVMGRAEVSRVSNRERIAQVVGRPVSDSELTGWTSGLRAASRLTVNFHPDRLDLDRRSVAAGLSETGRYYSQFVTGSSNGGRSAVPGGDRSRWEQTLFAGAYDAAADAERPIYGALDVLNDPHGGSPRFGSCFAVLDDVVFERCTFTVGDSHAGPSDVGAAAAFHPILAGLAEEAAAGRFLGRPGGLELLSDLMEGRSRRSAPARDLDHYVEVQVHGGVNLLADVHTIIADPSFRQTPVEQHLLRVADRYDVALAWHGGSEIAAADVPPARDSRMPALAAEVADDRGMVDARAIGEAARRLRLGPPTPSGDPDRSDAQQLKFLWHTVLAYGHDADRA